MTGALLNRLSDVLTGEPLRRQIIWSFLLGALSALSFVPVSAVAVLIPALIGLFWLIHAASSPRRAFVLGWIFGLGYFLVGLYWVGNAFFVYAERHAIFAVPGVLALCAILAIYIGAASWVYKRVSVIAFGSSGIGVENVLLFATLWTVFELIRGWAFTGFPWNPVGSVWVISDEILQSAAFGGVYLLSLVTIFVFTLPAILSGGTKRSVWKVIAGFALLGLLWGGGAWRLSGARQAFVDDVVLRLVQPNIAQRLKWQSDLRSAHVLSQIKLSLKPAVGEMIPTHVIWSETSVPYSVPGDSGLMAMLTQAVPEGGALIGGSVRRETVDVDGNRAVWNTMFVLDSAGNILEGYDKSHLVPFGEYVPFQGILPIEKLTDGAVGFSPGPGLKTLNIPGLPPFSPLICYEVIFSGNVVDGDNRPQWILNITNDAWYGYSAGPFQHFASARLRAVEEGLPVVRVANTGISGVIDPYGQIISSLDLEVYATLDSRLPKALSETVYGRYGLRIPVYLCTGILIYFILLSVAGKRRKQRALFF